MHLCIRSTASVLFPFIAESLNCSAASQELISFLLLLFRLPHHLVSLGCGSSLLEGSVGVRGLNAERHICRLCMRLFFIHLFIDLLSHFPAKRKPAPVRPRPPPSRPRDSPPLPASNQLRLLPLRRLRCLLPAIFPSPPLYSRSCGEQVNKSPSSSGGDNEARGDTRRSADVCRCFARSHTKEDLRHTPAICRTPRKTHGL